MLSYALLLGGFDGLHAGHRVLLSEAKRSGLPVAVTTMFGGKGKSLFTREERRFLFQRAGILNVLEIELTEAVRETPPEVFLKDVFSGIVAGLAVCGEDFRFGKDAAGTPGLLKKLAPCPVTVQKTVKYLAEESGRLRKISTTVCKKYLAKGQLSLLNACLCPQGTEFYGCAYFVQGIVEHGRQVGRTYGFPTLNLGVPADKLLPPDGVYSGMCETPKGNFPTVVNIGSRPTFGVRERKIEAYLDGFSGDLYGAVVRIYPLKFVRPIQKFPSAEALKEQLQNDIQTMRMNKKEVNV